MVRRRSLAPLIVAALAAIAVAIPQLPAAAQGDVEVTEGSPSSPFSQNKQNEPAVAIDANHPTVLARSTCFERIGLFDLRYRCAMDYDWFLRLHLAGGVGAYVPGLCGNMNHDGVSNLRWGRTMREVAEIATAHGRNPGLARAEMWYQIGKIAAGRLAKRHAAPAYRLARKLLNRSYRPVGAKHRADAAR